MSTSTEGMPPVPNHPEIRTMKWSDLEIEAIHAYGRLVAQVCAEIADDSDHCVEGTGYYDQLGDSSATQRRIVDAIRKRFNLETPK